MKADEFMAIAHFFTSEDVTRPSFNTPFRHGDHLFATDGRIADAMTGKLVWGRDLSAVDPDIDALRKGVAQ